MAIQEQHCSFISMSMELVRKQTFSFENAALASVFLHGIQDFGFKSQLKTFKSQLETVLDNVISGNKINGFQLQMRNCFCPLLSKIKNIFFKKD